jgi:hypothetical protein
VRGSRLIAFIRAASVAALLCAGRAAAEPDPLEAVMQRLLVQRREGGSARLEAPPRGTDSRALDVEALAGRPFTPGTAFGGMAVGRVNASVERIVALYAKQETAGRWSEIVDTIRRSVVLQTRQDGAMLIALTIKVPVLADMKVNDWVVIERFPDHAQLRWVQDDADSTVRWNRGTILLEPRRDREAVATVYGAHVLKDEHRISFLLRSSARSFGVRHYENFIKGMQRVFAASP